VLAVVRVEIDDAISPDAPILARVQQVRGQALQHPPAISRVKKGDLAQGFQEAAIVIERSFTTRPVHQCYM